MRSVVFTQRVEVVEEYHERRDCADQRIAEFITYCGYLPIPVPNKAEIAGRIIEEVDPIGIILTGGNSLTRYGGNAPERDEMENKLLDIAIGRDIPVYGFCRGMQVILCYFGNNLIHISGHVALRHRITSEGVCLEVNSYHNQACMKIKDKCGLKVTAVSEDGAIEMVEHECYHILGTMWHPERENPLKEHDVKRVRNLFGKR